MNSRTKIICTFPVIVGFVNFFAFVTIASQLGGDAVNGKEENGHYFLMSHGTTTEVSRSIFDYSRIHVYSIFITHPAAIAAGIILSSLRAKRSAMDNQTNRTDRASGSGLTH